MLFIVTVKHDPIKGHDPQNKHTGHCPVAEVCTDVTGAHHSVLVQADDTTDARVVARRHGHSHVTRVETITLALS